MSNAILQNPRTRAHTVHTLKEFFWFLPQVVGLIYLGGWQYIPGICLVYTPQFGLSIYRPYIKRFARNYFLLISTSSLKNSRTGAHFYPNRKTGKKFKRIPKKQHPPNTNAIKKTLPCSHILLLVPGSNIDPGVYCPEQYIPGTYLVYIAAKHR